MPSAWFRGPTRVGSLFAIFTLVNATDCSSDDAKRSGTRTYEPSQSGAAGEGSEGVDVSGSSQSGSDCCGGAPGNAGAFADDSPGGVSQGGAGAATRNACPEPTGVEIMHGFETVDTDATWSGINVIGQGVSVKSGAVLTLEPCTVLKFQPGQGFHVSDEGSVHAVGEPDKPIIFTSSRRTPAAGDWDSIVVQGNTSNDVVFKHVIVEYSSEGFDIWAGANVELSSVLVRQTKQTAITLEQGVTLAHFDDVTVQEPLRCMDLGPSVVTQLGSFSCTGAKDGTIGVGIGTITEPSKWKNWGVPYKVLTNNTYFEALVELEPGVEIQLEPGINLGAGKGGALRALGTKEQHVVFRSSKPVPSGSDWQGLHFSDDGSANSLLRWTDVRDAKPAVFLSHYVLPVENVDFSKSACGLKIYQTGSLSPVLGSTNDVGATCP